MSFIIHQAFKRCLLTLNINQVCAFFFFTQLWRGPLISMMWMRSPHSPLHLLSHPPSARVQSSTRQMMWGVQGTKCLLLIAPGLVLAAVLPRAPLWEIGWFPVSPSTKGQRESPLSMPTLGSTELPLFKTNSTLMASLHLPDQEVTTTVSIAPLPVWSTRPLQNSAPTQAHARVRLVLGNSRPNI